MIPARKSRLLSRWFSGHVAGRIRRTFQRVEIRGLENLERAVVQGSVLVVSNHTSWWDPMFCIYLGNRLVAMDGYAMMHAKNLRKLPFLGRLGGFGVEVGNSSDTRQALRYGADLLSQTGRAVWVFPQGLERPITSPANDFKPGAAMMAKMARQEQIISVGLRYEFGAGEKPTLLCSIGSPFRFNSNVATGVRRQQEEVTQQLALIDHHILEPDVSDGFRTRLASPVPRRARWAERALAWLTRYR